jgi:site-specific DNA-cytosine methylase
MLGHVERASGRRLMVGFGVPNIEMSIDISSRKLPSIAEEPPYFYFENVARAPLGEWDEMSRSLYDIEPEYVDSKYFCAASRKRGYIHNLPLAGRFPLLPMQSRMIKDAFPRTKEWWPQWDTRKHLNCIQTVMAAATVSKTVRTMLTDCDGIPNMADQKKILDQCTLWNLVWVGPKTVAALEPDEVESLLGFPRDHTRSFTRTERYRSLGNSFQVDTVAFHLSVLKAEFPHGIRVLSLFTGIGGAEVALHRLGIQLNVVVSAEISEVNQAVLRTWWEKSKQSGELIEIGNIEKVNDTDLEALVKRFGGFDLIVGGSPCNNLSGGNRHSRVGLKGEQSKLFYHYVRIVKQVRKIMRRISMEGILRIKYCNL